MEWWHDTLALRALGLIEMKQKTKNKLSEALDALWEEHGNGFNTEWELLIGLLQLTVDTGSPLGNISAIKDEEI